MAESWQESEIIPGLFVGDLQDAQKFDGTIISVLPDVPEGEPPQAIQMPFLAEGVATLDQTADLIDDELALGHRCWSIARKDASARRWWWRGF